MLGRRDRARAATVLEIKQAARRIVLDRGPQATSLRAVARESGMTAPGLYRYFASRQELLNHVAADILATGQALPAKLTRLTGWLRRAGNSAAGR